MPIITEHLTYVFGEKTNLQITALNDVSTKIEEYNAEIERQKDAIAKGGYVTLDDDITLDASLAVSNDVILDSEFYTSRIIDKMYC